MLETTDRQTDIFIPGNWADLIPKDHLLKLVHAVLVLSWLAAEIQ